MDLSKFEPFRVSGQSKIRIEMDKHSAATLTRRLEPYKNLPRTFKPAMEEMADYYRGTVVTRVFGKEGPGWAPLAPRTVNERVKAGFQGRHPILQRTGDLMKELTQRMHPKHVEVVLTGKHARIEISGSSKKFLQNQMGNPATHLPARPMVGPQTIQSNDRMQMQGILERAIQKGLKNGI